MNSLICLWAVLLLVTFYKFRVGYARPLTGRNETSVSLNKRDFSTSLLTQLSKGKIGIADIANSQDLMLKLFAESRTVEPYTYAPPITSFTHVLSPQRIEGERFEEYVWRKIKTVTLNSTSMLTIFGQNINVYEIIEKCLPFHQDRQVDERQLALEMLRQKKAAKSSYLGRFSKGKAPSSLKYTGMRRRTRDDEPEQDEDTDADNGNDYPYKAAKLDGDYNSVFGLSERQSKARIASEDYWDDDNDDSEVDDSDSFKQTSSARSSQYSPYPSRKSSYSKSNRGQKLSAGNDESELSTKYSTLTSPSKHSYGSRYSSYPLSSTAKRKSSALENSYGADQGYYDLNYRLARRWWFGSSKDKKKEKYISDYDEASFYSGYPTRKASSYNTGDDVTYPSSYSSPAQPKYGQYKKGSTATDYLNDGFDSGSLDTGKNRFSKGRYGDYFGSLTSGYGLTGQSYKDEDLKPSRNRQSPSSVYDRSVGDSSKPKYGKAKSAYDNDESFRSPQKKEAKSSSGFFSLDRFKSRAKKADNDIELSEDYSDKQLAKYYRNNRIDSYGPNLKSDKKKSSNGFFSSIGQSLVEWTMQNTFPCLQYNTVYAVRVSSATELDTDLVPRYNSSLNLQKLFESARDYKYVHVYPGQSKGSGSSKIKRAIQWDMSFDGSYNRADSIISFIESEAGLAAPYKIYAFGELVIGNKKPTPARPNGNIVSYHVAPVVYYDNELVVLDPSVNFKGPMTIDEWIDKIAPNSALQLEGLSICTRATYFWFSDRCDLEFDESVLEGHDNQKAGNDTKDGSVRNSDGTNGVPAPIGTAKVVQIVKKPENGKSTLKGSKKNSTRKIPIDNKGKNKNSSIPSKAAVSKKLKVQNNTTIVVGKNLERNITNLTSSTSTFITTSTTSTTEATTPSSTSTISTTSTTTTEATALSSTSTSSTASTTTTEATAPSSTSTISTTITTTTEATEPSSTSTSSTTSTTTTEATEPSSTSTISTTSTTTTEATALSSTSTSSTTSTTTTEATALSSTSTISTTSTTTTEATEPSSTSTISTTSTISSTTEATALSSTSTISTTTTTTTEATP